MTTAMMARELRPLPAVARPAGQPSVAEPVIVPDYDGYVAPEPYPTVPGQQRVSAFNPDNSRIQTEVSVSEPCKVYVVRYPYEYYLYTDKLVPKVLQTIRVRTQAASDEPLKYFFFKYDPRSDNSVHGYLEAAISGSLVSMNSALAPDPNAGQAPILFGISDIVALRMDTRVNFDGFASAVKFNFTETGPRPPVSAFFIMAPRDQPATLAYVAMLQTVFASASLPPPCVIDMLDGDPSNYLEYPKAMRNFETVVSIVYAQQLAQCRCLSEAICNCIDTYTLRWPSDPRTVAMRVTKDALIANEHGILVRVSSAGTAAAADTPNVEQLPRSGMMELEFFDAKTRQTGIQLLRSEDVRPKIFSLAEILLKQKKANVACATVKYNSQGADNALGLSAALALALVQLAESRLRAHLSGSSEEVSISRPEPACLQNNPELRSLASESGILPYDRHIVYSRDENILAVTAEILRLLDIPFVVSLKNSENLHEAVNVRFNAMMAGSPAPKTILDAVLARSGQTDIDTKQRETAIRAFECAVNNDVRNGRFAEVGCGPSSTMGLSGQDVELTLIERYHRTEGISSQVLSNSELAKLRNNKAHAFSERVFSIGSPWVLLTNFALNSELRPMSVAHIHNLDEPPSSVLSDLIALVTPSAPRGTSQAPVRTPKTWHYVTDVVDYDEVLARDRQVTALMSSIDNYTQAVQYTDCQEDGKRCEPIVWEGRVSGGCERGTAARMRKAGPRLSFVGYAVIKTTCDDSQKVLQTNTENAWNAEGNKAQVVFSRKLFDAPATKVVTSVAVRRYDIVPASRLSRGDTLCAQTRRPAIVTNADNHPLRLPRQWHGVPSEEDKAMLHNAMATMAYLGTREARVDSLGGASAEYRRPPSLPTSSVQTSTISQVSQQEMTADPRLVHFQVPVEVDHQMANSEELSGVFVEPGEPPGSSEPSITNAETDAASDAGENTPLTEPRASPGPVPPGDRKELPDHLTPEEETDREILLSISDMWNRDRVRDRVRDRSSEMEETVAPTETSQGDNEQSRGDFLAESSRPNVPKSTETLSVATTRGAPPTFRMRQRRPRGEGSTEGPSTRGTRSASSSAPSR